MDKKFDSVMQKLGWGYYPPEYNKKVHGPYNPATFYGKRDTAFGELKLNEVKGWLQRRNKNPIAIYQACGRAYWRWQHKYFFAKRGGIAPIIQLSVAIMTLFYFINLPRILPHNNYKYHW